MAVIAAYRRVLRNGALARLLVGEFVSSVGDWLYLVALLVVVYDEARDPLLLGLIGGGRILPYALLSVPAGILADRVAAPADLLDLLRLSPLGGLPPSGWKRRPGRCGGKPS